MSAAEGQGKGVLVIHEDGSAAWMSPLTPAVAGVRVGIGRGAVVEVDAANPSLVLGWVLQAGGDVDALSSAFGEPRLADQLAVLAASGDDVFGKTAPALAEAWVRRATVAAVEQCTVRPINEGALLLDQATADHSAGRTVTAANLFQRAAPTLLNLGDDCLSGAITGGAATDLAHVADVARQSLTGSGWESDVAALAERLTGEVGVADDEWRTALADWTPGVLDGAWSAAEVDAGAEMAWAAGEEDSVKEFFIDPIAVPPRVLEWPGADRRDLLVRWKEGSDLASISAALAESVDHRSAEATELIAYAADPDSGAIVAIAPMRVDGRDVAAQLRCADRAPEELYFGVYHADSDPGELRLDLLGRLLIEVDRSMFDAYNHQRFALAAIHGQPATADASQAEARRDEHLALAKAAAVAASGKIAKFLGDNRVSADAAKLLGRRLDAIDAYALTLDVGAAVPPGSTALLSELLPTSADDDDFED